MASTLMQYTRLPSFPLPKDNLQLPWRPSPSQSYRPGSLPICKNASHRFPPIVVTDFLYAALQARSKPNPAIPCFRLLGPHSTARDLPHPPLMKSFVLLIWRYTQILVMQARQAPPHHQLPPHPPLPPPTLPSRQPFPGCQSQERIGAMENAPW